MNTITLIGNLTRDAEIQTLNNGTTLGKFTLAVKRPFKADTTDFFDCVCFNKTADAVKAHTSKGDKLAVNGYIQIREYEVDGQKRRAMDVVVQEVEFLGKRKEEAQPTADKEPKPLDYDTDLPF